MGPGKEAICLVACRRARACAALSKGACNGGGQKNKPIVNVVNIFFTRLCAHTESAVVYDRLRAITRQPQAAMVRYIQPTFLPSSISACTLLLTHPR